MKTTSDANEGAGDLAVFLHGSHGMAGVFSWEADRRVRNWLYFAMFKDFTEFVGSTKNLVASWNEIMYTLSSSIADPGACAGFFLLGGGGGVVEGPKTDKLKKKFFAVQS